ncbi:piezo-type mechanosensitive ion channel component 1 isoform X1 [Tachysurus ichikawai]
MHILHASLFLTHKISQVSSFCLSLVFPGHTGRFVIALFSTSLLFLLAHVSFQVCLYTVPGLDDALGHNCEWELALTTRAETTCL